MERKTITTQVVPVAIILALIAVTSLILPIVLAGQTGFVAQNSQYIIGPAVNAALIYAALRIRGRVSIAAIICAPSVFALTTGLLFAVGNVYTLFMIPAIWLGNMALVLIFRNLHAKRKVNYTLTSIIAISIKVALIFGSFTLLTAIGLIPAGSAVAQAMTTVMGIMQLFTATAGCIIAYGVAKLGTAPRAINK